MLPLSRGFVRTIPSRARISGAVLCAHSRCFGCKNLRALRALLSVSETSPRSPGTRCACQHRSLSPGWGNLRELPRSNHHHHPFLLLMSTPSSSFFFLRFQFSPDDDDDVAAFDARLLSRDRTWRAAVAAAHTSPAREPMMNSPPSSEESRRCSFTREIKIKRRK